MTSGIYSITNLTNGHRYVGSSVDIAKRWRTHRRQLNAGDHHGVYLQRAWGLYGEAAFLFEIVMECRPEMLLDVEQATMDALAPEYNVAKVAGSQLGCRRTEETRAKMRATHALRPNWNKGRTASEETRAKMSAAKTGRAPWNKGKKMPPCTAEARLHMSAASKGRKKSAEHRAKISAALKGRPRAQAQRDARAKS